MKNILRKTLSACCSMVLTLGLTQLESLNANAAKFVGLGNGGHQCAYISLIQQLYSCENLKGLIKAGTIQAICDKLSNLFDLMDKAEEEWTSDLPKKESDLTQEEINKLQEEARARKPLEKRWVPISETQAKNWCSIEAEELGKILKDIYNPQQDTIDEAFMNLLGNSATKDHMMFISSDTIRHILAEESFIRDNLKTSIDLSGLNGGGLLDCFRTDLMDKNDMSFLANLFNEKDNVLLSIPQELAEISKGNWDFANIYSSWGYELKSLSVNTGGHFITWVHDELKDTWRLIDDSKLDPIEYSFNDMQTRIKDGTNWVIASLMYSKRQDLIEALVAEAPPVINLPATPQFIKDGIQLFYRVKGLEYELKSLEVVDSSGQRGIWSKDEDGLWSYTNDKIDGFIQGFSFSEMNLQINEGTIVSLNYGKN